MSRQRGAAVELLVQCLREQPAFDWRRACELIERTTPEAILEAADYHGVSGWIYSRLSRCPSIPERLIAPLRTRYDAAVRRHLRATWELAGLAPVLDASGARWAVIKGPAVVELIYLDPGLRPYGDIDVIVEPGRFAHAVAALERSGSPVMDRNWEVIRRDRLGELHVRLPRGTLLDLHWNLVNMYRGQIAIDTESLLRRAERVELCGVNAPTLDPTDSLIHVAMHGTLAGGDKLRWIKDTEMLARVRPPDWEALVQRAEDWGVAPAVGLLLRRSNAVLGAPIPEWTYRRLLGKRYERLVTIIDRLSPWQRATGRVTTPSLLLTRSMGLGLYGAFRWLIARSVMHFDPREPGASSNFTERGDEEDRAAFFADVMASSRR